MQVDNIADYFAQLSVARRGRRMHAGVEMQEQEDPVENSGEQANREHPVTVVIPSLPAETGGRGGLEPTRYGDWEKNGRCIDF